MKKLGLLILLLAAITAGAHYSGARDFSQVSFAWKKLDNGGEWGAFFSDLVTIIKGEKLVSSQISLTANPNQIIYRWKDELGQLHFGQTPPKDVDFEVIKQGDLKLQTQKSMSKDEIDQVLKPNDKKKD